jgi:hypothetical protein
LVLGGTLLFLAPNGLTIPISTPRFRSTPNSRAVSVAIAGDRPAATPHRIEPLPVT